MPADVIHRYTPRGAALALLSDRSAEVLLSGPAGTGKSRAGLEKLHLMALANPGMRGLIVRKTRESLGSTALVTWREHVAVEAIKAGIVTFYGGSAEQPAQYRYSNGSRIMIGGMDKPTKIMSSEYDVAYAQEAIELTTTDWENITTRLRNGKISFQQLIADCNPDKPTHWLKQRCNRGETVMLYSRHEDNPRLYAADGTVTAEGKSYLSKLDALTGVRKDRLRYGRWVAAEGIIYEGFDPGVHVIDRFDIPPSWTRWWSVDFGFVHPFVCQCWAEDPDGRLILEWEIYRSRRLVEDHAKTILEQVTEPVDGYRHPPDGPRYAYHGRRWTGPKPRAIICDHNAEDRATLERHLGMSTAPAHKSVSDGIQAVQGRFKTLDNGRTGIVLFTDALVERDPELVDALRPTCTAEEIPGYVWATSGKEEPVKVDDDGCDAMRYIVAEKDLAGRPRIRFM